MTIVQINVSDYGSTGAIMQTVQTLALCKGHSAKSFAGRRIHLDRECESVGNKADLYFHAVLGRLGKNGHGSKLSTASLVKKLKDIKPDAVVLHNIHGYFLNLKILFEALNELPDCHIYWVLHDCWAFTGGCAYFSFADCRRWETCADEATNKPHCGNCKIHSSAYPKSYIDTTAEEFAFKRELFTMLPEEKMTVITPSEWLAEETRKSFLNKYEIKTILNGVNIETFQPHTLESKRRVLEKYNIPADKPVVLGVASVWNDRKQPQLFYRLSEIAQDCAIVMVGLSVKQMKKLPPNVIGISRTENTDELACIYSAASVLLHPSLEDNFPLVPLEALACGTPVITSSLCGCPEQVSHETGIILTNPTSVNEAYRAVQAVLEAQKKAASLSIKETADIPFTSELCRKRAVELYDNYKMASKYMELIESNHQRSVR